MMNGWTDGWLDGYMWMWKAKQCKDLFINDKNELLLGPFLIILITESYMIIDRYMNILKDRVIGRWMNG